MLNKRTIALLIFLLGIPFGTYACSCSTVYQGKPWFNGKDIIAAVEVVKVDTVQIKVNSESRPIIPYAKHTLRIIENFRESISGDTILVYSSFSDCGYHYKAGMKYLISASPPYFKDPAVDGTKYFETTNCHYNTILTEARIREVRDILKPTGEKVTPVKFKQLGN